MIRLRITPDGRIRGLWTDEVAFTAIGHTSVRRASHVEFDGRRQRWTVREAQPHSRPRRWLQELLGRPLGRIVATSPDRASALKIEAAYFGPGGEGWCEGGAGRAVSEAEHRENA